MTKNRTGPVRTMNLTKTRTGPKFFTLIFYVNFQMKKVKWVIKWFIKYNITDWVNVNDSMLMNIINPLNTTIFILYEFKVKNPEKKFKETEKIWLINLKFIWKVWVCPKHNLSNRSIFFFFYQFWHMLGGSAIYTCHRKWCFHYQLLSHHTHYRLPNLSPLMKWPLVIVSLFSQFLSWVRVLVRYLGPVRVLAFTLLGPCFSQ